MPCSGPREPLRLPLGVERVGDRQRVGIDLDDRAQRRTAAIDLLDALQVELDESTRGVSPGRHPVLQLGDGRFVRARTAIGRLLLSAQSDDADRDSAISMRQGTELRSAVMQRASG